MRNPRLETVLGLAVELIMAFTCVFLVLTLMESFLVSHSIILTEIPPSGHYYTFLVSMIGGASVMICATAMDIAEHLHKHSEISLE